MGSCSSSSSDPMRTISNTISSNNQLQIPSVIIQLIAQYLPLNNRLIFYSINHQFNRSIQSKLAWLSNCDNPYYIPNLLSYYRKTKKIRLQPFYSIRFISQLSLYINKRVKQTEFDRILLLLVGIMTELTQFKLQFDSIPISRKNRLKLKPESLQLISRLSNLQLLCLDYIIIPQIPVTVSFNGLSSLISFTVSNSDSTVDLAQLQSLFSQSNQVVSVNLNGSNLASDDNLSWLCQRWPQLTALSIVANLTVSNQLSNSGLHSISQLNQLTLLDLSNQYSLTDAVLQSIAVNCSQLQYLSLDNCGSHSGLTELGLISVSNLTGLTALNLSNLPALSDSALQLIFTARLGQRLNRLVLSNNLLLTTDAILAIIPNLTELRRFSLYWNSHSLFDTNKVIKSIKLNLTQLHSIGIDCVESTCIGLAPVIQLVQSFLDRRPASPSASVIEFQPPRSIFQQYYNSVIDQQSQPLSQSQSAQLYSLFNHRRVSIVNNNHRPHTLLYDESIINEFLLPITSYSTGRY